MSLSWDRTLTRCLFQVHGTQSIQIIKDIPLVSGPGWTWKSRYTGVNENSVFLYILSCNMTMAEGSVTESGIVLTAENTLVSPDGEVYAKLYVREFLLLSGDLTKNSPRNILSLPEFFFQHRCQSYRREILQIYRWPTQRKTYPKRPSHETRLHSD